MTSSDTVVVVQRFLAHYRISFVRRLGEELQRRHHTLHYFYSRALGTFEPPPWCVRIPALSLQVPIGKRSDTLLIPPNLLRDVSRSNPSVLVVGDVGEIPSNLLLARFAVRRRIPYLVWGLGRIPHNPSSRWRSILAPLIRWFYSRAAGFICYGVHAKEEYSRYGRPCFIAVNATLDAPNASQRLRLLEAIAARQARPIRVACIGQLTEDKRVDVLLRALARLPRHDWTLDIVGSGACSGELTRLAESLQLAAQVRFHGELFDAERKFEILSRCHIGVLPGRGGLAIQELMWHGVSVISGVADGTESDLIDHDNGILKRGWLTEADIAGAIEAYRGLPDDARRRRANTCMEKISSDVNVERMVDGFLQGVLSVSRRVHQAPSR